MHLTYLHSYIFTLIQSCTNNTIIINLVLLFEIINLKWIIIINYKNVVTYFFCIVYVNFKIFSYIIHTLFLIIPPLFLNNSRISSTIKIPKIILAKAYRHVQLILMFTTSLSPWLNHCALQLKKL